MKPGEFLLRVFHASLLKGVRVFPGSLRFNPC